MNAVDRLAQPQKVIQFAQPKTLEEMIALRVQLLTDYQDSQYAQRYVALVRLVEEKERALEGEGSKLALAKAVARSLYKAMAYKDEYEVARLHADPEFRARIADQFDGDFQLQFHMAPPLLSRNKPGTAIPAKRTFGAWMLPAMGMLAKLKRLRGTRLDVFGYTEERRLERAWRDQVMALAEELACGLNAENKPVALKLASVPDKVRGFGHVKLANLEKARQELEALRLQMNAKSQFVMMKRA
jgi:indolepyruvate ferredoxin oxidoreductase